MIYLSRKNKGKGIYHVVKQINVPITLCKIQSNHPPTNFNDNESIYNIFTKNINKEYSLSYENYNTDTNQSSDSFMNDIKNKLY